MASEVSENSSNVNDPQNIELIAVEALKNSVENMEIGSETLKDGATLNKENAARKKSEKTDRLEKRRVAAAAAAAAVEEADPLGGNYGDLPLEAVQSKEISGRLWTKVGFLTDEFKDKEVLIRGRAHAIRGVSNKIAFLVVREAGFTVQCVLSVLPDVVNKGMVKFATAINKESIIEVEGIVSVPDKPIKGASQQVEIKVQKLYCISRSVPTLPINLEDAARSEKEFEKAEQTGEHLVRVGQDTRLNYRVLDLRTPANQGIFRLQSHVSLGEEASSIITFLLQFPDHLIYLV